MTVTVKLPNKFSTCAKIQLATDIHVPKAMAKFLGNAYEIIMTLHVMLDQRIVKIASVLTDNQCEIFPSAYTFLHCCSINICFVMLRKRVYGFMTFQMFSLLLSHLFVYVSRFFQKLCQFLKCLKFAALS